MMSGQGFTLVSDQPGIFSPLGPMIGAKLDLECPTVESLRVAASRSSAIGTYLASQMVHPTRWKSQQLHCFLLL
jgi:hypothetical protein